MVHTCIKHWQVLSTAHRGLCSSALLCLLEPELGFSAERAAVGKSHLWVHGEQGANREILSQPQHAVGVAQWEYSGCFTVVLVSAQSLRG